MITAVGMDRRIAIKEPFDHPSGIHHECQELAKLSHQVLHADRTISLNDFKNEPAMKMTALSLLLVIAQKS